MKSQSWQRSLNEPNRESVLYVRASERALGHNLLFLYQSKGGRTEGINTGVHLCERGPNVTNFLHDDPGDRFKVHVCNDQHRPMRPPSTPFSKSGTKFSFFHRISTVCGLGS